MICALISPTFSLIKSRQSFLPAMMASRASFTHAGQSESVCRGKPSVGLVFSQDLSSGLSDHCGVTDGFGLRLLKCWIVLKVIPSVLHRTHSIDLKICVATRFDINLHPPLSKLLLGIQPIQSLELQRAVAPGPKKVLLQPYHLKTARPLSL